MTPLYDPRAARAAQSTAQRPTAQQTVSDIRVPVATTPDAITPRQPTAPSALSSRPPAGGTVRSRLAAAVTVKSSPRPEGWPSEDQAPTVTLADLTRDVARVDIVDVVIIPTPASPYHQTAYACLMRPDGAARDVLIYVLCPATGAWGDFLRRLCDAVQVDGVESADAWLSGVTCGERVSRGGQTYRAPIIDEEVAQ